MSDQRKPPGDGIADASSLFDDDADEPNWGRKPSHTPRAKPAASPPKPVEPPPTAVPLGGEYDVEGLDPDDDAPPVPRTPVRPTRAKAAEGPGERRPRASIPASRSGSDDDQEERQAPDPEDGVGEVWTRWGEWGPTLTKMGIVAVVMVMLAYFAGASLMAFLIVVAGIVTLVALSYPIAVTLERPMRLTPEQALKDFYAAASHHFPQYRRMWLLLSDAGRDCAEFDSYSRFRSYWVSRMARVRGNRIKALTPLTFIIKEFRSDKSAGQTVIEAEYTIAVRARGATGGSAEEYPIEGSLVRGPDKMWYLNSGVLPEAAPASRERKPS